jgi:HAD superfamily hydrolase (TIGR01549 family)
MSLKAVFFDLHGTLAFLNNPVSSEEASQFLQEHNYYIYPQSLDAASHFVSTIDYPKYGYQSWQMYLERVMGRLNVKIDNETLEKLAMLFKQRNNYTLFQDAAAAVIKTKELNLKTAIITTIASFIFYPAIMPIKDCFDSIITGYEAGCEKSNPKMHMQALQKLDVASHEAVMIGDELLVDIKIPKKLGMYTILLDRTNKIKTKPHEADAKAATLTEAVATIERWQKA